MLILTARKNEKIFIYKNKEKLCCITNATGAVQRIKLGFEADPSIRILREKLLK